MDLIKNASALLSVAALSSSALAGYTITQGSSAPTYTGQSLNFDEAGGPTGIISPDAYASIGISELQAGDSVPQVGNWDPIFGGGAGWLGGATNSFYGNFGVFMTLDHDVTEMSLQVWDPSGPPSFFGGGLNIFLFNDGVQVADITMGDPFGVIATPAWGGVGDSWFDIVGTDGDVFDEVRILGFGFGPTTFVDDITWNPLVVEPACPGDVNGDGRTTVQDLLMVIINFGECSAPCSADLNGDGIVNFQDILAVISDFGCGACADDSECDDGDPCTRDRCVGWGMCINTPIHGCDMGGSTDATRARPPKGGRALSGGCDGHTDPGWMTAATTASVARSDQENTTKREPRQ